MPLGRALVPDASFLSPRGKVLENGMPRFFRRLAMGVFDVEDLKQRALELASFVEDAATAYDFDPQDMTAVGYSNGANIAAAMLFLTPRLMRRAVLLHPMVPFVPEAVPDLGANEVLITGGERDQMIPRDQTDALVAMLTQAGASVGVHLHRGGHELTPQEVVIVRDWLNASYERSTASRDND